MGARRASRLWLFGGVVAIVVLVAATYLLAIKPVYDDKALKESQVEDMDVQLVKLKHDLADLKTKADDIASYTAQLTAKKKQLPDSYDIPNYLRQLQGSDGSVKVDNSSIGVSTPVAVTGSTVVVGVPISLIATGTAAGLTKWFDRLLSQQTRATLINTATLSQDTGTSWRASVMVTVFCNKSSDEDCQLLTS